MQEREDRAALTEIERRTRRRIDGGAVEEADLWMPAPTQPKSVANSIKNLARDGKVIVRGKKLLMARYVGWARDERRRKPPETVLTLQERRVRSVIETVRKNVKIAGITSRFHEACIANEQQLAECVLAALEQADLIPSSKPPKVVEPAPIEHRNAYAAIMQEVKRIKERPKMTQKKSNWTSIV